MEAMSRRAWLAAAWAALALTACGCLSDFSHSHTERGSKEACANAPPPPTPLASANSEAIRAQKSNSEATRAQKSNSEATRAQKPDERPYAERGNEGNIEREDEAKSAAVCHLLNLPVDRPAEAVHAKPAATIRAVVNGELILEEEVLLHCQMDPPRLRQLFAARSHEEREAILKQAAEELIDREVLIQNFVSKLKRGGKQGEAYLNEIQKEADKEFDKNMLQPILKREHLTSRAELVDFMRQKGVSLELMRRWYERNWMARQYLFARLESQINRIGHTEISEYYNSHRDEYTQPDSVDWQDIFLDAGRHASRAAARQFAETLVERVRQGEDFVKLSAEFDNGESGRFRKGAGHGHKRGEIFPPEAEKLLFQMREGDTGIVECPHGFHVVHLVKRQYAGPIPFDAKVQKEIRDKLRNLVFQRERESIVKELKRKAVIDRCD
jgi:parvulin-like peptidyl-prolyl isomerase